MVDLIPRCECEGNTGHVTYELRDGKWFASHVDPVIWFAELGTPSIADVDHLWTYWDNYAKLTISNGTWIWRFTGRTCVNRFGGNVLREAKWPD